MVFATLASISAMFEANFLRQELGYWDSVRYSADSELIERARILAGNRFAALPIVSMFCLSHQNSLTNDPQTGISQDKGVTPIRKQYHADFAAWHVDVAQKSEGRLPFPHEPRHFPAPDKMIVKTRR